MYDTFMSFILPLCIRHKSCRDSVLRVHHAGTTGKKKDLLRQEEKRDLQPLSVLQIPVSFYDSCT